MDYLACAIFLYAVQEQLLMGGLRWGHAGSPYQVGHHHLVALCHQQLARPNPLHLPAPVPSSICIISLSCRMYQLIVMLFVRSVLAEGDCSHMWRLHLGSLQVMSFLARQSGNPSLFAAALSNATSLWQRADQQLGAGDVYCIGLVAAA